MTLPPTEVVFCGSCRAPIVWARTVPKQKRIPLDAQPCEPGVRGSFLLVFDRAYSPNARTEALADYRQVLGDTRTVDLPHHLSHFATCPRAAEHRRTRSTR